MPIFAATARVLWSVAAFCLWCVALLQKEIEAARVVEEVRAKPWVMGRAP